ncbi:hypothetical protein Tcan_17469 [Toxocara canis]|uniref:Uncharacterized protein n=1 Tax=Toxocara canis TaxID=6265 RepID=A0A0B2VN35_TOXCA|nr:hypothetical protein Tcan_17469 [Toxocara canis]
MRAVFASKCAGRWCSLSLANVFCGELILLESDDKKAVHSCEACSRTAVECYAAMCSLVFNVDFLSAPNVIRRVVRTIAKLIHPQNLWH